jgi:hypothetical protein
MTTFTEPTAEELLAAADQRPVDRDHQAPVDADPADVDEADEDGVPLTRVALWAGPPLLLTLVLGVMALPLWLLGAIVGGALVLVLLWLRRDSLLGWLRGESGGERRAARYAGRAAAAESRGRGESRTQQRAARKAARAHAMGSAAVNRPRRGERRAARAAGRDAARSTRAAGGSRAQARAAKKAARAKAMGAGARPSTGRPSRRATRAAGRAAAKSARAAGGSRAQARAAKKAARAKASGRPPGGRAKFGRAKGAAGRAKSTRAKGAFGRAKSGRAKGAAGRAKSAWNSGPSRAKSTRAKGPAGRAKKTDTARAKAASWWARKRAARAAAKATRAKAPKEPRPPRRVPPVVRRTAARVGNRVHAVKNGVVRYAAWFVNHTVDEVGAGLELTALVLEKKAAEAQARAEAKYAAEVAAARAARKADKRAAKAAARAKKQARTNTTGGTTMTTNTAKTASPNGARYAAMVEEQCTSKTVGEALDFVGKTALADAARKAELADELKARANGVGGYEAHGESCETLLEQATAAAADAEEALSWGTQLLAEAAAVTTGGLPTVIGSR